MSFWLPVSALVAGLVQTVAYVGNRFFYESFGVTPEEVGYDYASLLPRTAYQVALFASVGLAAFAVISLIAAFYAGLLKPLAADVWRDFRSPQPGSLDHGLGVLFAPFLATAAVVIAGAPEFALEAFIVVGLAGVALDYAHARRKNEPEASLVARFLAPRTYRGTRRLLLLAIGALIPTTFFTGPSPGTAAVALCVIVVYAIDRFLPVVNDAPSAPGGGRSPWLWRVGLLALAGAAATAFLEAFPAIIKAGDLDRKVAQVKAGERLTYSLLNPLALAEPRADPVEVRWIAPNPPPPFSGHRIVTLTYFGQNAGTSVFFDARPRGAAVYRLPTAAITMQASP